MVFLDEDKQQHKIAQFRKKEDEHIAKQKATRLDLQYVDLTSVSVNTDALQLISEDYARKNRLVVFTKRGKNIGVAAHDPESDGVEKQLERLREKGYKPTIYVASPTSLERAYSYYKDISHTTASKGGEMDIVSDTVADFLADDPTRGEALKFAKKALTGEIEIADTSQLVEVLVAAAIAIDASDIHIEAGEKKADVRMRIDGVLEKISELKETPYKRTLSRLKLLSGMKLNINDKSQDGRFSIKLENNSVEVRSSVVPGSNGESVVMRVLNQKNIRNNMEDLGMQPHFLKLIREEINRPNGLILNTGPTGSGKTTTLYSFLQEINNPQMKTITIENPIEYHLDSIVQTQVNTDKGYGFFEGLKSAMRQDPDVIMVGEIRDNKTAETAVHAGLTGHRVLSTLHTNDAAGTFPRLAELGVKNNLIDSTVNAAMAQRLVRKLCENCREKVALSAEQKEVVDALTKHLPRPDEYKDELARDFVFKASGCNQCGDSGYKGRTGVFEAVIVDAAVGDMVRDNPADREIWAHTQETQGILSMAQDGLIKALNGVTDLDELARVIDMQKAIRRATR